MSLKLPLLPKVASLYEAESIARDFESVISLAGPSGGVEHELRRAKLETLQ